MEAHRFDVLLARAVRQTSRRAALAALVGGALLLANPAASDATNKAKRRKRRKRRGRSASAPGASPSWVWIENPGPNPVRVSHGEPVGHDYPRCCFYINQGVTIPPGGRLPFAARGNFLTSTTAFVVIADRYWLVFDNPEVNRPDVSAAIDGPPTYSNGNRQVCCGNAGTTVVRERALGEEQTTYITMLSRVFTVSRYPDTNYKVFNVVLPANL
jgi:hypothetical protein